VENRRVLLSKLNDAGTRKLFEKKAREFDKKRKSVMDKIEKSKYLTDDQKKLLSTIGNISEAQKRFEVLEGKLKSNAAFENLKTKAKKKITKLKINNSREYLQKINLSRTKNQVSEVIREAEKRERLEQFKKTQKAQVSDLKMLPKKNKDNYLKNIDEATSERQVEASVKGARNTDEKLRKKEESLREVAKSWIEKSKVSFKNASSVFQRTGTRKEVKASAFGRLLKKK